MVILARYVAHCLLRQLPSILADKCELLSTQSFHGIPKAPHYVNKKSLTYYTILKFGILGQSSAHIYA